MEIYLHKQILERYLQLFMCSLALELYSVILMPFLSTGKKDLRKQEGNSRKENH